jgi:hypothetical protein
LPVKTKWGLQSIQQPLFCQYLGIFSRTPPASDQILVFLKALQRHFKYISVYHFQPSLFPMLLQLVPLFPGFLPSTHSTDWLSLSPPYPELYRGYSQDRKKNLKKSMRFAWHCHTRPEIAPLIRLFRENHERQIAGGVNPQAYTLLQKLADLLLEKQIASIVYAELEGQIRAGIMMMDSYGKIIYIFNAADTVGRKGNARTFLLNHYIQLKANTNEVLDFESPEIDSIAHFYRSFGATPKNYMALKMNRLPLPLQYIQRFRQWIMQCHK